MTTVYDVDANELIKIVSKTLKDNKDLKAPAWTKFVKTGVHKERPPEDKNWWYMRLASLLRNLYIQSKPTGIQRIRTKYGGRRKRSYKPKQHFKAGGKIIRTGLQMLEKQGLVKTVPKKGRELTPKGKSLLDKAAAGLVKAK